MPEREAWAIVELVSVIGNRVSVVEFRIKNDLKNLELRLRDESRAFLTRKWESLGACPSNRVFLDGEQAS